MSSRFWAGGDSSDSDKSEDENSTSSDESGPVTNKPGASRWAVESDSDSEDEVRVVKSAKEKAWDSMKETVAKIKNHMKINDWNGIQTNFEDVNKQIEKAKTLLVADGPPPFYIRLLAELEDFLAETLKDKDAQKKMNGPNARSLNRMKLLVRKHNKSYEEAIAAYRENPTIEVETEKHRHNKAESDSDSSSESSSESSKSGSGSDSESDSGSESGSESEEEKEKKPATKKVPREKKDLDEMDSDEWASDSEDSSSESEKETELKGRAKWLKKVPEVKQKKERQKVKETEVDIKRRKEAKESKVVSKAKEFALDINMSAEDLDKKVLEVVAHRGRSRTNTKELLKQLQALAYLARRYGPRKEIPVLMQLVSVQFDTLRTIDECLDVAIWKSCWSYLIRILSVLEEKPELKLGVVSDEDIADLILAAKGGLKEKNPAEDGEPVVSKEEDLNVLPVIGNLAVFALRLEEEYTKSLQKINPHTQEYIQRLRDEKLVMELAERVQAYYSKQGMMKEASTMSLMKLEHMYYKHDSIALSVLKSQAFQAKWGNPANLHPACLGAQASLNAEKTHPASVMGAPQAPEENLPDLGQEVERDARFIYKHGGDRERTRAMLCHITHHALHDRFHEARDLLLMSHLQDTIGHTDVNTQILFNRMMVLLGLCAFRLGLVKEAHACLTEICSSRTKELLAQGVQQSKFVEKTPEQEKEERRRQVPYHMHINLDLLECCHLTAAMLLEVPNMALHPDRIDRKYIISRHFRKHKDIYERQVFTGPPENTREHVLAASNAILEGAWKRAAESILNLEVWNLLPGKDAAEKVKAMLNEKIKREALRTYLFTFGQYYDSLSLPSLCEMFELEKSQAHSLISKMIITEELRASWDQPTETVVLHRTEPTPLQSLALQLAEKTATLVDSNERLLDARSGGYGYAYKEDWRRRTGRGGGGSEGTGRGERSGGRGMDRGGRAEGGGERNESGEGGGRGMGGY